MPSPFERCIAKIKKAGGDLEIDDKTATKIIKALAVEKGKVSTGLKNADQAFTEKLAKIVEQEKTKSLVDKRNAMINLIKHKDIMEFTSRFKNDADGLKALLVGVEKPIEGARDSIASRQQALFAKYMKGLVNEIESEGLLPAFQDKKNSGDLAIEYVELNKADRGEGAPGRTKNTDAVKLGKILKRYSDDIVGRLNNAGSWIQDRDDFLLFQSHDMNKVRKAGYAQWRQSIEDKVDFDKTLGSIPAEKQEEVLHDIYKDIASGNYLKAKGAKDAGSLPEYLGPGGLSKRLAEQQTLKFVSPEKWNEYDKEFGAGSTQTAIIKQMERSSKNIALMERLGTDPNTMLKKVIEDLKHKNRENQKVHDYLNGKGMLPPDNLYKELNGEANIVQNLNIGRIVSTARGVASMVSLGSSLFSQIPDIAIKASELRYQGRNPLYGYAKGFIDIFEGFQPIEKKRLARALGAGYEGILHEINGRLIAADPIPGTFSTMQQMFFKLTGMEYWNDAQKMGMARSMSAFIAEHSDVEYKDLDSQFQNVLKLYSLHDRNWEVLKLGKREVGGREYVTPDSIREISDEQLQSKGITGNSRTLEKYRENLETQYREYLSDRVDHGMLTPGPAEKAIWHRGTQPGTLEGELLRTMSQFKMFSTSVISRVLPNQFHGSAFRNIAGLSQLILGSTLLGYLAITMNDVAKGKGPRNPDHVQTWVDSINKGGALGLYADYLFNDYSRHTIQEAALGPVAGRLQDFLSVAAKAYKGEAEPKDFFKLAEKNAPFVNIFYIKTALDYLILYQLQESLEPGFINKMTDNMQERYGQSWLLPPDGA